MSKISKEDYQKSLEIIKEYNLERIKLSKHWGKKVCKTCGSIVKSAVAGHCENCWENGFHNEA